MVTLVQFQPSSTSTVDRFAEEFEVVSNLEKRLGMAHKEVAVWLEQVSKPLEQLALGCLIEVDHHVPTEDDVKGPAHGPGAYEVELAERNEFLQGWNNTHQTSVRSLSLTEPALPVFWC
jgi:hypothetical protein